ncbi:hypothetical protein U1Q18_031268 [Sarracenia purpurea var. burkii]
MGMKASLDLASLTPASSRSVQNVPTFGGPMRVESAPRIHTAVDPQNNLLKELCSPLLSTQRWPFAALPSRRSDDGGMNRSSFVGACVWA